MMKKVLFSFFLITALTETSLSSSLLNNEIIIDSPSAKNCHQASRGPPGIQGSPGNPGAPGADGPPGEQGPQGINESTAFGSFYSTNITEEVPVGDTLSFPLTAINVNISHPNNQEFVIVQPGFYGIDFGVGILGNDTLIGNQTIIAVYVDGVEAVGSRLAINSNSELITLEQLTSTMLIIPLTTGQTVTVRNNTNIFDEGTWSGITSFFNIYRLSPLP